MNSDRTARRILAIAALLGASLAGAQTMPAPAVAPASPAAAAPATGGGVVPPAPAAPPAAQPIPAARWTSAQIAQSFDQADTNSDGRLTRAEAQRLAIVPFSFEEMDVNKDGIIDRAEYEGAFTRQPGS
jgi:hypothetical protein